MPVVVGYLGCQYFSDWYPWPYEHGWQEQLNTAFQRWYPILQEYSDNGVKFAHEIAIQQMAYNLETAMDLISRFDIDSFGYCIDPSNFVMLGIDPSIAIEQLSNKVLYVHGKDAELTHNFRYSGYMANGNFNRHDRGVRFRIPGWGDSNWKKIINSLRLIGYDGNVTVEFEDPIFPVEEGVQRAQKFLKEVL